MEPDRHRANWLLDEPVRFYRRGERVADRPLRAAGFYVDPYGNGGCRHPIGPFPTHRAAQEWAGCMGRAVLIGNAAARSELDAEAKQLAQTNMIAVIGASGRSGAALCRALREPFRAVVRSAAKWEALGIDAPHAVADLQDPDALRAALAGASVVISCAHARNIPAILAAAPEEATFVFMGSTRRYSRWPDSHGDGVRAGEAAFLASGRAGFLLHPTMIYGAQGEDNVQRLAALMRRLPVLPLPGGGRNLVQPIHQDDVTDSLIAAAVEETTQAQVIVIAGPQPVAYRDFCAAIARAAGFRPRPVLPLPASLLVLASPLARLVPSLPRIGAEEIRRLTEDKDFDTTAMREILGIEPLPLAEGLLRTFS